MKEMGRVFRTKEQVLHAKSTFKNRTCFVCGLAAKHKVLGKRLIGGKQKKMYCCTKHFVMMFKMAPQRHPKQVKKHTLPVLQSVRDFTLRNFMEMPYSFRGERVACHDVHLGQHWFFSLYNREAGCSTEQDPYRMVVTLTRVFAKKHAVNLLRVIGGTDNVVEAVEGMIGQHDVIVPLTPAQMLHLKMEATRFFENCVNLPAVGTGCNCAKEGCC